MQDETLSHSRRKGLQHIRGIQVLRNAVGRGGGEGGGEGVSFPRKKPYEGYEGVGGVKFLGKKH